MHIQAGDLQDLHSQIQQQAAMLQNVSGLAEEVRHAIAAKCGVVLATRQQPVYNTGRIACSSSGIQPLLRDRSASIHSLDYFGEDCCEGDFLPQCLPSNDSRSQIQHMPRETSFQWAQSSMCSAVINQTHALSCACNTSGHQRSWSKCVQPGRAHFCTTATATVLVGSPALPGCLQAQVRPVPQGQACQRSPSCLVHNNLMLEQAVTCKYRMHSARPDRSFISPFIPPSLTICVHPSIRPCLNPSNDAAIGIAKGHPRAGHTRSPWVGRDPCRPHDH